MRPATKQNGSLFVPREVKDLKERIIDLETQRDKMWATITKRVRNVDELMTQKIEGQIADVCRFYEAKMNVVLKETGKHIMKLRAFVTKEVDEAKKVCADSKAALADFRAIDTQLTEQWERIGS